MIKLTFLSYFGSNNMLLFSYIHLCSYLSVVVYRVYAVVNCVGSSNTVRQINMIPRLFQNLTWARCSAESSRPQLSKGAEKIATWVCPLAAFQVTDRIFRRRLDYELVPCGVKIQRSARDVYSR